MGCMMNSVWCLWVKIMMTYDEIKTYLEVVACANMWHGLTLSPQCFYLVWIWEYFPEYRTFSYRIHAVIQDLPLLWSDFALYRWHQPSVIRLSQFGLAMLQTQTMAAGVTWLSNFRQGNMVYGVSRPSLQSVTTCPRCSKEPLVQRSDSNLEFGPLRGPDSPMQAQFTTPIVCCDG